MKTESFDEFRKLSDFIENQHHLKKDILTLSEAAKYLGLSKSNLYKKTSAGKIPYYKPEGKIIYFKREELDAWMLRNKSFSREEIKLKAESYNLNKRRVQK